MLYIVRGAFSMITNLLSRRFPFGFALLIVQTWTSKDHEMSNYHVASLAC